MACLESDSSEKKFSSNVIEEPFDIYECRSLAGTKVMPNQSLYSQSQCSSQCTSRPDPPPLPRNSYGKWKICRNTKSYNCVPEEILNSWDKLFFDEYQADLRVLTDDGSTILSHSCVLGMKYPALKTMMERSEVEYGFRRILISGVPSAAVRVFIRFLYSSRFEQEEMKNYALHVLVLSHVFSVPSLKMVCIHQLERFFLAPDNVVDMLQLARLCDAPRLCLICTNMIIGDFKTISLSEGWKVMRQANPGLEQELLEALVEADTYVGNTHLVSLERAGVVYKDVYSWPLW